MSLVKIEKILNSDELNELRQRTDGNLPPGTAWYAPWLHDPNDPEDMARLSSRSYLSRFFKEKAADKRAPIVVVCPNGEHWCIDAKSNNGEGWQVTINDNKITCTPSIVVSGYHGFLTDGQFTADIEGRGDCGIKQNS